jgi:hypothetical protein
MLCYEFEDRLTDYLDGVLDVETHKNFAAHAMRCPVCHDLLSEVKNTLVACSASEAPPASAGLEARILMKTMPEASLTCAEFEEHLTDYLDGFLIAPLYHRWERHAALCDSCSELPGAVVRANRCLLHLQAGRTDSSLPVSKLESCKARLAMFCRNRSGPRSLHVWSSGCAERLDPIVSPQLASVATMLLVSIFVLTNTVSTDGSVGGIYHATVQLAQRHRR